MRSGWAPAIRLAGFARTKKRVKASHILQGVGIILALTTGLAQLFTNHTRQILYVGYALAVVFLIVGFIVAHYEGKKAVDDGSDAPRVAPVRYGQLIPGGFYGLVLTNEHESVAYDVCVPERKRNIPIGSSRLVFWDRSISRLTKSQEALIDAHIELSPRTTMTGDGLHDEMVKNNVIDIEVPILYKDADNHWYETTCKIERDVLSKHAHGITVRYGGRKPIKSP